MTNSRPATVCALTLFLASTGALAGGPTSAQAQPPAGGVAAAITVTGCLERWSATAAGSTTDPATTEPPAGVEFVLRSAEDPPGTGTAGDAPEAAPRRYLLLAGPELNLAAHQRHTVRVHGAIAPQPTAGASPADQAVEPSARETNLPERAEPAAYRLNLIQVDSLTMISTECRG
jgi:hypothetical protein